MNKSELGRSYRDITFKVVGAAALVGSLVYSAEPQASLTHAQEESDKLKATPTTTLIYEAPKGSPTPIFVPHEPVNSVSSVETAEVDDETFAAALRVLGDAQRPLDWQIEGNPFSAPETAPSVDR